MLDSRYRTQVIAHKHYVTKRASMLDDEAYSHFMSELFLDDQILNAKNSTEALRMASFLYVETARQIKVKRHLAALETAFNQVREILLKIERFEQ